MYGGIVGRDNYGCELNNCINYGTITATSGYAGGMVGYYYDGNLLGLEIGLANCVNYGKINSAQTPYNELVGEYISWE